MCSFEGNLTINTSSQTSIWPMLSRCQLWRCASDPLLDVGRCGGFVATADGRQKGWRSDQGPRIVGWSWDGCGEGMAESYRGIMHKPHVVALFCWCWYGSVSKCCFAKGCALLNLNCQCIHIISEEQWNEASIRCLFACGIVDSSRFSSNCLWSMSCAFKACAILQMRF